MYSFQEGLPTKLRIIQAVDRPLEELSVNEICQKAGVSRQTFYNHFEGKHQLIAWWGIWVDSLYLDNVGRTLTWEEGYLRSAHLLAWGKPFMTSAFAHGEPLNQFCGHPVARQRVATLSQAVTERTGSKPDPDLLFCIKAFSHVECEHTIGCYKEGHSKTSLIYAKQIVSLIPPLLYDTLQLPEAKQRTQRENFALMDEIEARLQDEFDPATIMNQEILRSRSSAS